MLRYSTTRILSSLFILWVISVLVIALMNVLPGDPAAGILGVEAAPELIEATKRRLGLISGYLGGKLDELIIMRIVDALMAMPGLILMANAFDFFGDGIRDAFDPRLCTVG